MKKIYLIVFLLSSFLGMAPVYGQVEEALYMVGNATPVGWNITEAIEMTKNGNVFTYEGKLVAGEFKFPVNRNADWNQNMYMRDIENPAMAYLHIGGEPDDNKWTITEPGNYTVRIDVSTLMVEIIMNFDPSAVPEALYMVGDATPNGWTIEQAAPLTKSGNTFFYDGILKAGTFKFPVNRNTDWQQTMYMKDAEDETKFYKHVGGASDDSQWTIENEGWYRVELNFALSTIRIVPIYIYMVGSATSVGWDIGNAIQFGQDPDQPYLFSYYGELFPGEFKFPINQQTDWGQDMYMKNTEDTTRMYYHIGGTPDDSKWIIGQQGYYTINVDIKNMTVQIINDNSSDVDDRDQGSPMRLLSNSVAERLTVINGGNFDYQVVGITGSVLKRGASASGTIDVNDLKRGVYLLKLDNHKGSVQAVKFLKR